MEQSVSKIFFYGSAVNRLNSKGQVAIPKRFRDIVPQEEHKQGFVLVMGEGGIYMYTHRQFGVIKDRVRVEATSRNDPEFLRAFMENAHAVDIDNQGRFVLPLALRKSAGIAGPEVLFIGMDDRIEIWAPEARRSQRREAQEMLQRDKETARKIFGM